MGHRNSSSSPLIKSYISLSLFPLSLSLSLSLFPKNWREKQSWQPSQTQNRAPTWRSLCGTWTRPCPPTPDPSSYASCQRSTRRVRLQNIHSHMFILTLMYHPTRDTHTYVPPYPRHTHTHTHICPTLHKTHTHSPHTHTSTSTT